MLRIVFTAVHGKHRERERETEKRAAWIGMEDAGVATPRRRNKIEKWQPGAASMARAKQKMSKEVTTNASGQEGQEGEQRRRHCRVWQGRKFVWSTDQRDYVYELELAKSCKKLNI